MVVGINRFVNTPAAACGAVGMLLCCAFPARPNPLIRLPDRPVAALKTPHHRWQFWRELDTIFQ